LFEQISALRNNTMTPFVEDINSPSLEDSGLENSSIPIGAATKNGYINSSNSPQVSHDSNYETSLNSIAKVSPLEPIAICGMSVRLPGGIHSPQELWKFLISKGDARGPVPKSRYNALAYYSETPKPGSIKSEYGYFLDGSIDIASVDTSFFSMGKSEAERADPQQRQMLEVARECVEDAGETNWKGRPIGCFMGSFGEDWVEMFAKDNQQYGQHRASGYGDFMLANRVSYEMDLTGPR
jgi:acyl transferase domain-containing protein